MSISVSPCQHAKNSVSDPGAFVQSENISSWCVDINFNTLSTGRSFTSLDVFADFAAGCVIASISDASVSKAAKYGNKKSCCDTSMPKAARLFNIFRGDRTHCQTKYVLLMCHYNFLHDQNNSDIFHIATAWKKLLYF